MKVRALALGALLGFVAAVAPSCGPAKCGPNNCAGCCTADDKCVATPHNADAATCGAAGNSCTACTSGQVCGASFTCVAGTGMGGGSGQTGGGTGNTGGGTGNTCANGCLNPLGGCTPYSLQSPNACGTAGNQCAACPSGNDCVSGVCTAPTAVAVGAACETSADCAGLPVAQDEISLNQGQLNFTPAAVCKTTGYNRVFAGYGTQGPMVVNGTSTLKYPDGYCTKRCISDDACGDGNVCTYQLGIIGEFENICVKKCEMNSDCRDGYICLGISTDTNVCVPDTTVDGGTDITLYDAGHPGTVQTGSACTATAQCAGATNPQTGFCNQQSGSGTSISFPGGFCSADCSATWYDDNYCGPGSICTPTLSYLSDNTNGPIISWTCSQLCAQPGKTVRNLLPDGGDDGIDGGDVDAGTPETDAGMDVDAGTPETDAGTPETDAGTPETDAGTPETDGGTVTDGGTTDGGFVLPACRSGYMCTPIVQGSPYSTCE